MKYVPGRPGSRYREDDDRTFETGFNSEDFKSYFRAQKTDADGMEDSDSALKSLMRVIYPILLIGSLICVFVFAFNGKTSMALLFMPVFLFIMFLGIATSVSNKTGRIISVFISIIALSLIVLGAASMNGDFDFNARNILLLILIYSGVLSLVFFIFGIVNPIIMNKKCTTLGVAKVIGFEDMNYHSRQTDSVVTRPVYAIEHNGQTYKVLLGDSYTNIQDIPAFGSFRQVFYNADNPYDVMMTRRSPILNSCIYGGIICLVAAAVCAFFFSVIDGAGMGMGSDDVLTDKYIQRNILKSSQIEYTVYERVVVDFVGSTYYFDEIGGIGSQISTNELYEPGERVYWIQTSSGYTYMLPAEDKEYVGDYYYTHTPAYMTDGRFFMSDEYISNLIGTNDFDIYEVTFKNASESKWEFLADDGRKCELYFKADSPINYWNISSGERFYWISSTSNAVIFSTEKNVYTGTKTVQ